MTVETAWRRGSRYARQVIARSPYKEPILLCHGVEVWLSALDPLVFQAAEESDDGDLIHDAWWIGFSSAAEERGWILSKDPFDVTGAWLSPLETLYEEGE